MEFYETQFKEIHQLLKEYGGYATFDFEPEYKEHPICGGIIFYKPEELMHTDGLQDEWKEIIDARLDMCVQTKKGYAEKNEIRFDIEWSQRVHLYSMHVSLPTRGRSKFLSLRTYESQEAVITEIRKWLQEAGCREIVKTVQEPVTEVEQMSLF